MRPTAVNAVASATGIMLLIGIVSVAAYLFASEKDFWFTAIAGHLFTVPLAVSDWSGSLRKSNTNDQAVPPSWQYWLVIFTVGLLTSTVFVLIDFALVHPGFSLIFTIGAVAMTFIALPSAVRAWLLELLSNYQDGRRKPDA